MCRSRPRRMEYACRRVLITSFFRKWRSFSFTCSIVSSRAEDQRWLLGMDTSRRIHTWRASLFELSDATLSPLCDGGMQGKPSSEYHMHFSDKGGFRMPFHTWCAAHTEDKMPKNIDSTSELRAEFEMSTAYFQKMPTALTNLWKKDPNGIYANNNINLDHIPVFGFDYDYTLAHYTSDLQTLIYDLAKRHLVEEFKYPNSCLNFEYNKDFPIRGLYYDMKKGYLLKLDSSHAVEPDCCYFGHRKVEEAEIVATYGDSRISAEYIPDLRRLMDLFCLSEICLISDVIEHYVKENLDYNASYVYQHVQGAVEAVHKSGLLHKKILEEPEKYLVKSQGVVQMLEKLKNSGKVLFLLTNSRFPFVDGGMKYMFEEGAASGGSWRDLFDVVIVKAGKPNFYESETPFRRYDEKRDVLTLEKVNSFQSHSVYSDGCLRHLHKITKWKCSEVLYFGDHVYTDLRLPMKDGWRTAAIIRELEREIQKQNEDEYRLHQAKYHNMQNLVEMYDKIRGTCPETEAQKELVSSLRKHRSEAQRDMKLMFNQYFGSTFLAASARESAFAYNVVRYADVYTSRLENFLNFPVDAQFYTPFEVKYLPHHIKVKVPNTRAPAVIL